MSWEEASQERESLIESLDRAMDPRVSLRLILSMGLRSSDISPAIGVDPDEVTAWVTSEEKGIEEHEMAVFSLKSVTMFFLRRGLLSPSSLAGWLKEPHPDLGDMTPLEALSIEGGMDAVLRASTPFLRPEPQQ